MVHKHRYHTVWLSIWVIIPTIIHVGVIQDPHMRLLPENCQKKLGLYGYSQTTLQAAGYILGHMFYGAFIFIKCPHVAKISVYPGVIGSISTINISMSQNPCLMLKVRYPRVVKKSFQIIETVETRNFNVTHGTVTSSWRHPSCFQTVPVTIFVFEAMGNVSGEKDAADWLRRRLGRPWVEYRSIVSAGKPMM